MAVATQAGGDEEHNQAFEPTGPPAACRRLNSALAEKTVQRMDPTAFIKKYSINCFFHFTDTRNLPSIKANGGLLSMAGLRRHGIPVGHPGGNEWSLDADVRFGMDRYVHLCLFDQHPMEFLAKQDGRIEQSRFLRISPAVLHIEGVVFSPEVSNKAGAQLLSLAEADAEMDFEVVYTRTDWRDPAVRERRQLARKYELLVPNAVPLNYIMDSIDG